MLLADVLGRDRPDLAGRATKPGPISPTGSAP
jgi:hypothetical protein